MKLSLGLQGIPLLFKVVTRGSEKHGSCPWVDETALSTLFCFRYSQSVHVCSLVCPWASRIAHRLKPRGVVTEFRDLFRISRSTDKSVYHWVPKTLLLINWLVELRAEYSTFSGSFLSLAGPGTQQVETLLVEYGWGLFRILLADRIVSYWIHRIWGRLCLATGLEPSIRTLYPRVLTGVCPAWSHCWHVW